jgi:hypothetical protein
MNITEGQKGTETERNITEGQKGTATDRNITGGHKDTELDKKVIALKTFHRMKDEMRQMDLKKTRIKKKDPSV